MKYDNIGSFEKHLVSSAPDHFSHLYLILSKEEFDGKEALDKLLHALLPKGKDNPCCFRLFDGQNLEIEDVLTELNSISFLEKNRVFCIQHVDKLKKVTTEALETYFLRPHPGHYLVLIASALPKNTNFYKNIEKAGVVLEITEAKPWEKEKKLIEWVNKQVTLARKLMPYQACQYLVKCSGFNSAILKQELEKLFCYVGDRSEITLQDVSRICTYLNAETIWQLGEALFCRDARVALRICRALLEEGHAFLPLLRQIRTQFQTGYHICTILMQGGKAADITQEYPYMKGQILERHLQLAREYGLEKFRQGLISIDTIEIQAKNSQVDDTLLADLLLIKLIQ